MGEMSDHCERLGVIPLASTHIRRRNKIITCSLRCLFPSLRARASRQTLYNRRRLWVNELSTFVRCALWFGSRVYALISALARKTFRPRTSRSFALLLVMPPPPHSKAIRECIARFAYHFLGAIVHSAFRGPRAHF